jgi:hypothetical protein
VADPEEAEVVVEVAGDERHDGMLKILIGNQ